MLALTAVGGAEKNVVSSRFLSGFFLPRPSNSAGSSSAASVPCLGVVGVSVAMDTTEDEEDEGREGDEGALECSGDDDDDDDETEDDWASAAPVDVFSGEGDDPMTTVAVGDADCVDVAALVDDDDDESDDDEEADPPGASRASRTERMISTAWLREFVSSRAASRVKAVSNR